jgi:hypothetical protein
MKIIAVSYLFFLLNFYAYCDSIDFIKTLIYDLENIYTVGYKPIDTVEKEYTFIQGSFAKQDGFCFAIQGDGFFKIYDDKGNEFYTRSGFFIFDEYGELITTGKLKLDNRINTKGKIIKNIFIDTGGNLKINYIDGRNEVFQMELYVPEKESKNICHGNYYSFSKVRKMTGSKFVYGFLELSAVDGFLTVLKLQKALYELYINGVISKIEYEYNIQILGQLQNYILMESFYKLEDSYASFVRQTIQIHTYDYIHNFISFLDLSFINKH